MRISVDDIISFVLANGEAFDVSFSNIEFVGIDKVVNAANQEMNVCDESFEFNSKEEQLSSFFAESFGHLFDLAWIGA